MKLKFGGAGGKLTKGIEEVWIVVENPAGVLLIDLKIVEDISRFAVTVLSVRLNVQVAASVDVCFHVRCGVV